MASNSNRLTPRQKMINLMYIVLTAMLALNVSSDVLDGFTQVHDGLNVTNRGMSDRNAAVYRELEAFAATNPEKGDKWLDKASDVRRRTLGLLRYVDSLQTLIVREADGPDGNPDRVENRDDLEASSLVMLSPSERLGQQLRRRIDAYRNYICALIPDTAKQRAISAALNTASVKQAGTLTEKTWEELKFDRQPVVAAITLLTKIKSDLLTAEGEALTTLLSQVDAGDVRVNQLNAYVLPQSRLVMRGGKYSANIVLAAVDTTARPAIYVGGKRLGDNGLYEFNAGQTGTFNYSGYLEVPHGDGTVTRHPFQSEYTVIEPSATVSATMMNVLYAGIDNPVDISVPGVPMQQVSASISNGSLVRSGDRWVARVSSPGQNAVVTVTAAIDGRPTTVGTTSFRVRRLPDPTAYLPLRGADGNIDRYKGSKPITKQQLMGIDGLEAAIDDGLLDTRFNVLGFETIFFDSSGNAAVEISAGDSFSPSQKRRFQSMRRGQRFYITKIRAKGPDGTTRDLSPIEVIVN